VRYYTWTNRACLPGDMVGLVAFGFPSHDGVLGNKPHTTRQEIQLLF
jgi:hypothetical protein